MSSIDFKFGGALWTAIYNDDYDLIDLLDPDGKRDFMSKRAVDKAVDSVHEVMMSERKLRRSAKPKEEIK